MVEDRAKSSITKYWPSFFIILTGATYLMMIGGYTWRGSFDLQLGGLILGGIGFITFLFWRGVINRRRLSPTGLEVIFGFALLGLGLSLVFSPAPGEGLWQSACLIGYLLLFYLLIEGFTCGLDRKAVLDAILWVSGISVALAVVETWQWYSSWWAAGGGFTSGPPYQYRFIGLLMSSIPLMALANLMGPLALAGFRKDSKPLSRLLKGVWLAFYVLALPFSSSRAAWLGMITWVGVLAGFWAYQNKPWQQLRRWSLRRKMISGVIGCLGLLALVLGAGLFYYVFTSNPSHGSDPLSDSGRSIFWKNAVEIWLTRPLVGAGPGRFGLAYLAAAPDTLPGFWPFHAHSTYLAPLSVFGMIGAVAFLAILVWGLRFAWKNYRRVSLVEKPFGKAILAGLASLLVQMFFDEFSVWIPVMACAITLLAWLATFGEQDRSARSQKYSINWLWIPGLAMVFLSGWSLWAYQPASGWASAVMNSGWSEAANLFLKSAQRDPTFALYPAEAGIASANAWLANHDLADLNQAQQSFQNALKIEPAYSVWWADLSVLDWYAGDQQTAIDRMQKAIQLSPRVPDYHLNLGWYGEQMNSIGMAKKEYARALELSPAWAGHPFWQANLLRSGVLADWQRNQSDVPAGAPAFWEQARAAMKNGNLEEAKRDLAYGHLLGEPFLPLLVGEGQLAQANKDLTQARQSYSQAVELMAWNDYPAGQAQAFFLERFMFNRNGLGSSYVPGYMTLSADVGQFQAAEWLYSDYRQAGDCPEAQKTWQLLQKARMGLTLDPVALPQCGK